VAVTNPFLFFAGFWKNRGRLKSNILDGLFFVLVKVYRLFLLKGGKLKDWAVLLL
jgi:hypothetical protein